jgi:hypothetical protein
MKIRNKKNKNLYIALAVITLGGALFFMHKKGILANIFKKKA